MDETTRTENMSSKPIEAIVTMDIRSAKLDVSSPVAPNMKALDTYAARLFSFLKIVIFMLLLLAILFILIKIYTQQGIVIMPFEASKKENLSGIAISDQLTAELMRIQQIHNINNKEIILRTESSYAVSHITSEQMIGKQEIIIPKKEIMEISMANTGAINMGSNSLDPGKLIIAFKNICPFNKVNMIRGSLQRYGSTIVLVALLEGDNVQSWTVRQPIDNKNEERLHEMIRNMAFMIAHDLPQSKVSAKTWEGLKYYTEALDAYHQYDLSGSPENLSLAGNYSLRAISSERGYEKPFELLSSLESIYVMIGRQNDASELCNKTIELYPTSAYSWMNRGLALNGQSKYDEALKAINMSIELNSQNAAAWNDKGIALAGLGKIDEAIKAYDMSIELNSQNAAAWNNKGSVLAGLGKIDEAIEAINTAIELNSQNAAAWNNKGNALAGLGKSDEAIKAYHTAIQLEHRLPANKIGG
jgi:tetratricopeptide (TPR) repeat protein